MITLTNKAIEKIQILQGEDELDSLMQGTGVGNINYLRAAVRPGGCSGFSYDLFFDLKGPQEDDIIQEFDRVTVIIDPQSAIKLEDAILDYVEGLAGTGFKWINPAATRTCGCGESFS